MQPALPCTTHEIVSIQLRWTWTRYETHKLQTLRDFERNEQTHHDGRKLVSNVEVNASDADREHDVNYKTKPVVSHVSWHVYIWSPRKSQALPEEPCLTAPRLQNSTLLKPWFAIISIEWDPIVGRIVISRDNQISEQHGMWMVIWTLTMWFISCILESAIT